MMIGKLAVTIVAVGTALAACDSISGGGRSGGMGGAPDGSRGATTPSAGRPAAATPSNPSPGMAPGAPPAGMGAGGPAAGAR